MIRRLHLGYIVIIFAIFTVGIYFGKSVLAADTSPKDSDAFYTLRYHSSGIVRRTTLAVYSQYTGGQRPTNGEFNISKAGLGCMPSGYANYPDRGRNGTRYTAYNNIRVSITVGSRTPYNEELKNCKNDDTGRGVFNTYAIQSGDWYQPDGQFGRWRADLTVEISGGDNNNASKYPDSNPQKRAWFQFKATARGDLLMTNRANAFGSPDYQTNYGVTQGSETGTIRRDGRDRATTRYEMPFAMPCTDNSTDLKTVGVWDPDEFHSRIKVQESPRSSNSWSDVAISNGNASGMNGNANGLGYYTPMNVNDDSASLKFNMTTDKKYRIVLVTERDNVVSLFWPYDSIQSENTCDYELIPRLDIGGQTSTDPGAKVLGSAPVENTNPSGYPATERTTRTVTKFVYTTMPTDTVSRINDLAACGSFASAVKCDPVTNESAYLGSSINPATFDYLATDSDIGKYICFVNSVSFPRDIFRRPPNWSHSDMKCTLVAKKPKVQILGSDLRTLGSIGASMSKRINPDEKTYGSWAEYGAFSTGPNALAGSGSSFRNGTTSDENSWSQLTFSNTASTKGNYGLGSLPATTTASDFDNLESNGNLGTNDISGVPSGVYNVGDISLNGNIMSAARSVIIRSSGRVTINGDITINDGIRYTSPDGISQVVIVANNIVINGGVSRVDAWLLTRNGGSVNTCSEVGNTGPLVASSCPKSLEVNGAVITDKLYLRRTGGADADTHPIAAEVFNLRASSYMWAYNFVNKQDRAQTTYIKELPPRF